MYLKIKLIDFLSVWIYNTVHTEWVIRFGLREITKMKFPSIGAGKTGCKLERDE